MLDPWIRIQGKILGKMKGQKLVKEQEMWTEKKLWCKSGKMGVYHVISLSLCLLLVLGLGLSNSTLYLYPLLSSAAWCLSGLDLKSSRGRR